MDMGDKAASAGVPLSMVLEPTETGSAELAHPAAGLSLSQRKLLSKIDGRRPLSSFVGTDTGLSGERLSRDGLRLLALGLARTDEPFVAPATIMRPFVATGSSPASPVTSAPPPATASPRPTARRTSARAPKRGVPTWLWAGGAAAVAVIAGGVLVLRPPAAPVQSKPAMDAMTATNTTPAQTAAPAPAPIAVPPARPVTAAPVSVAPPPVAAVETRPSAEAAPAPQLPEPRAVAPSKPAVPVEKAPAPAVEREPRIATPVERAQPQSVAVAPVARSEPVRPATNPQPAPERSAPVEASAPAPVAPAAATPVAPVAVAPSTAARPAPPPAPSGPRGLLPQEREFGAVVGDSEQLARQAAGLAPVQRTPPIFPRAAIQEGVIEGAVRVRLTVAADGSVEKVETSVSDPRYRVFEHAARAAAMTWTFVPGAAGRTHESVVQFRAP